MDEPFGAVDPIVRDELQRELLRLQRELGKTIVFVTHDIDEAFLLGDQVVILRQGGVVAQAGTPAEILADPADDFVASFIGADKGKRDLRLEQRDGDRGPTSWSTRTADPTGVLEATPATRTERRLVTWTSSNLDLIRELTLNHVAARRSSRSSPASCCRPARLARQPQPRMRAIVIGGGSLLYTIPSLPLFVILPLVIGTRVLDEPNLVVALSIYGVAIMVRSASDALASVAESTLDASTAMGFSPPRASSASSCRWPDRCCWPGSGWSRSARSPWCRWASSSARPTSATCSRTASSAASSRRSWSASLISLLLALVFDVSCCWRC